ncbi:MAG TPA: peptide ABC transporter ATP-binding protein, partial [Micromonosporaceae bacterium]
MTSTDPAPSGRHHTGEPLLKVENLVKHFPVRGGFLGNRQHVRAVDGVSF